MLRHAPLLLLVGSSVAVELREDGLPIDFPYYTGEIELTTTERVAEYVDQVSIGFLHDVVFDQGDVDDGLAVVELGDSVDTFAETPASKRQATQVVDWTTTTNPLGRDVFGTARSQGQCGSCFIFSAVNVMHATMCMQDATKCHPHLAEQHAVDCESKPCEGGLAKNILEYWEADRGLVSDNSAFTAYAAGEKNACADYATVAGDRVATAPIPSTSLVPYLRKVYRYVDHECNACLIAALRQGPLKASVRVEGERFAPNDCVRTPTDWRRWLPGTPSTNHAVNLVGFNLDRRTWILRNSWGPDWGTRGNWEMSMDTVEGEGRCLLLRVLKPAVKLVAEDDVELRKRDDELVASPVAVPAQPDVVPLPVRALAGNSGVSPYAQFHLRLPAPALVHTWPLRNDPTIWDRVADNGLVHSSMKVEVTFWIDAAPDLATTRTALRQLLVTQVAEISLTVDGVTWRTAEQPETLTGVRGLRFPLCWSDQGDAARNRTVDLTAPASLTVRLHRGVPQQSDPLVLPLARIWWVNPSPYATAHPSECTVSPLAALRTGVDDDGSGLSLGMLLAIAGGAVVLVACACIAAVCVALAVRQSGRRRSSSTATSLVAAKGGTTSRPSLSRSRSQARSLGRRGGPGRHHRPLSPKTSQTRLRQEDMTTQ